MSDAGDVDGLLSKPARSSLLVAFVALLVLGFGYGSDVMAPIALAAVSGLFVVGGWCLLATESIRARTPGSVALFAGVAGIAGSFWYAAATLPTASLVAADSLLGIGLVASTALAVTAVGGALLPADPVRASTRETIRDGVLAAALSTPILALVFDGRALVVSWEVTWEAITLVSRTPSIALVSLQLLGLVAFVLVAATGTARRSLRRAGITVPPIGDVVDAVRDWHEVTVYIVAGYAFVWWLPGVRSAIDSTFVALGPLGHGLAALLTSGLPVALVLVATLGTILAPTVSVLSPAVRSRLEPVPLRTIASAAGGLLVPIAIFSGERLATGETTSTVAWAVIAAAWLALVAVRFGAPWLVSLALGKRRWRRRLVGLAAGSLFVATVLAAMDGLSPIGVIVGVASVLLVWDLGTNALAVHRTVGPNAETTTLVGAHAVATLLVVGVGAGLGLGTVYAARWVSPSIPPSAATAAIVLSLVAVFAVAVDSLRLDSIDRSVMERVYVEFAARSPSRSQAVFVAILLAFVLMLFVHPAFGLAVVGLLFILLYVAMSQEAFYQSHRNQF